MNFSFPERIGGIALIIGALLFAAYSSLYLILLPIAEGKFDYAQVVRNPAWLPLAVTALSGIALMMLGFYFVYARIRPYTGFIGAIGFFFIESAYFLQGCKVTWDIFIYPVIVAHAESAFLLADGIIWNDPNVILFRAIASLTILAGIVLFSLAVFHSRRFPPTFPALIFIGAIIYAVGPYFSLYLAISGIFIFAVGCLMLGVELMRHAKQNDQ